MSEPPTGEAAAERQRGCRYIVSSDQRGVAAADEEPSPDSLRRQLEAQRRATRELTSLVDQLRRDIGILFDSWTWRIGYLVAQGARQLFFWRSATLRRRHWTRRHFDDLLASSPAYRRERQVDVDGAGGFVDLDPGVGRRGAVDVETAMREVWESLWSAPPGDAGDEP